MGLELAEQLGWAAPDVLMYPTGGGTGLVGIAKAWEELTGLGWLRGRCRASSASRPRAARPWSSLERGRRDDISLAELTSAPGLRVPSRSPADRCSGCCAKAAVMPSPSATTHREAQLLLARLEGLWTAPEAAATVAGLIALMRRGQVTPDARVVLILTGSGLKNPAPPLPPPIDHRVGRRDRRAGAASHRPVAPVARVPRPGYDIGQRSPGGLGMAIEVGKIRNVGVVGHGGVGKTSLVEALLFTAGAVTRLGRVEDGSTTSDFDPMRSSGRSP